MMTNAELAILSLVVEKSRHGYEIELVIEEREMQLDRGGFFLDLLHFE